MTIKVVNALFANKGIEAQLGAHYTCDANGVANVEVNDLPTFVTLGFVVVQSVEPTIVAPVTGATVTAAPSGLDSVTVVNPLGTLAALTVNVAAGFAAGQKHRVVFTQIITALTLGANIATSPKALPSAAAVGDSLLFVWSVTAAKWLLV